MIATIWRRAVSGLVLVLVLAPVAAAQEAVPLDRKELDKRISKTLSEVYAEGSQELYNKGFVTEAAYLFEGGLMGVIPMLDHHPELQEKVRKRLARAKEVRTLDTRAWMLRDIMFEIQGVVRQGPVPGQPFVVRPDDPLFKRVGGEENVKRIISDWVDACIADPKVNFFRDGTHKMTAEQIKAHKERLVLWSSEMTNGIAAGSWKGPTLAEAHQGMKITDTQFNAAAAHLEAAMFRHNVQEAERRFIMAAVASTRSKFVDPGMGPPPPTLWARLGEKKIKKIIDDFVDPALKDPKVNATRSGKVKWDDEAVAALKEQMLDLASLVTEGPRKYKGPPLQVVFKGVGVTDAEFDATLVHLEKALIRNEVSKEVVLLIMELVRSKRPDVVQARAEGPTGPFGTDVRLTASNAADGQETALVKEKSPQGEGLSLATVPFTWFAMVVSVLAGVGRFFV